MVVYKRFVRAITMGIETLYETETKNLEKVKKVLDKVLKM